ncbi:MAG: hypothetical protein K6E91_00270 [Butyrivibrio sp.]|nr:hypothetical protein [Butyrivibrio sp.]
MDIKTIFEDNIKEYSDFVDTDVAENINRIYYRGIAGHGPDDNSILSLLIWELKNVEDEQDTESELKWLYTIDPSYISPLMKSYHDEALNDDVRSTFFESPPLEKEREDALSECDFSLQAAESKDINITVDECKKLSIARKDAPPYIQSIAFLDNNEFYQGLMNILFKYDNPALEDLAYLSKTWFEQSVSCFTKTDDKVTGFLLVHACPSGILVPVLLFAVGADSRMNLVEMLRFSIKMAAEIYPGDTIIRIHRRNSIVSALSKKLFPDKKGEPVITGKRSEDG